MYMHDAFAAHHFAKLCGGWYDKETHRSLRHIFVGVKRRRLFKARRQPEALSAAYSFETARGVAERVERPPTSSSSFYARGRMKREMRFLQEAAAHHHRGTAVLFICAKQTWDALHLFSRPPKEG
jgi:hypothetical protein